MAATATNNPDSLVSAWLWLYEIHNAGKEYDEALNDFKMATRLRDSVTLLKNTAKIEELVNAINVEKELHRIDTIKRNVEITRLHEVMEKNWRNTIIMLAGMLALSGISIFVFYRKKSRLQQELKEVKDDLRHLQSFREKLFTVLSYDLKNSLSSFENLAQSLSGQIKSLKKDESVQLLTHLTTTAGDLKDTLNNVVQWVGFQANAKPFRPEILDSKALMENVIDRFRLPLHGKDLTASVFMPAGQNVYGDPGMIGIILENLLSNAIHFTKTGGMITCFSGKKDNLVLLGVKDTGTGISEEDIEKLFNAREDFHAIGKSSNKGAGVGLILCKELVERNGGRMYVESTVGEGSTFYFTLPEKKFA